MNEVTRKIALLDLDAFFAAVEVLRDPSLKNKPFAVGGGGDRGVVATANYLARRFGVHSAMSGHRARQLCPQLIFVKPNFAEYKALSYQVREILAKYTPLVEPASIDEFYLDLTDNVAFKGSASLTVEAIRKEISRLGITGSAGISNQKMVAKIASDDNKPNGQKVVPPEQVFDYIAALPLKRIPGVGPKSQETLARYGLTHGHHIQTTNTSQLQQKLGEAAIVLASVPGEGKVSLVAAFSKKINEKKKLLAGKFIGEIAKICGGGGGGRPTLAQAGGRDPKRLAEALSTAKQRLMEKLQ